MSSNKVLAGKMRQFQDGEAMSKIRKQAQQARRRDDKRKHARTDEVRLVRRLSLCTVDRRAC